MRPGDIAPANTLREHENGKLEEYQVNSNSKPFKISAEVVERTLDCASPLKIKRGLNALWRDGGILYAPPAR